MKSIVIEKKEENIEKIANLFKSNMVGAVPCDTIYGISALVNKSNSDRIYEIKRRPKSKNFITLLTLDDLKKSNLEVPAILFDIYPAPLTAILKGEDGETHALRVPNDDFMLSLLSLTGPLYSTSVNISGEKSLLTFEDVLSSFDGTLDFIVKAEVCHSLSSTMIDMTQKPYKVIRMGAYDPSLILST